MTKQKKSFLDKITKPSENEEEEKQIEVENREKNYSEEDSFGEDKIEENKKSGGSEEWLDKKESSPGEEGQLTVDVYQKKDLIIIKSIIGGVRPEDLDISITSDMVTIRGSRTNPDEVIPEDYYYQECFWGNFSRSIILPSDIRTSGVEAIIKNGILTIKLPKIEKNSSLKITVKEE